MKVAVVFFELSPEAGGVYTFTESIYDALKAADSRHEFVFYAKSAKGRRGVTVLPAGRASTLRHRVLMRARDSQDRFDSTRLGPRSWFERSLEQHGVDLVWFAANYAEDCDLPFIFTVFDVEHARQPWFPEVSARGEWERRQNYFSRYIPKATRVIVPNEAGREQVIRYWRIEPDRFLLLGHPTSEFARAAASKPLPPRDVLDRYGIGDLFLFYPAQFWAHKNHPTLLEALSLLDPSYELVCVGSDKGEWSHVRQIAQSLGVEARVHFLGFVPTVELVTLYRHAHALTYVSLFGPENLPPLEAMALGCPVIAADVPGASEQLGDAAIRVAPLDPTAIAAAVLRLADVSERERIVAAGRERALRRTPEHYVRGVIDFLDDFERTRRAWH